MNSTVSLEELGWRSFFDQQVEDNDRNLIAARVTRRDVGRYHLLGEQGVLYGILRGRARAEATSKAELPAVGDWVLCTPADPSDPKNVVIERTLERFSKFSRRSREAERFDEQIVAANVDTVFIVTGLDDNFSPTRIERYLLLAWESGARPVIVLSKADVCDDLEERLETLAPVTMGTPVHVVSAISGAGMDDLAEYLKPGETIALLGSSGVGKSTIINALLGYERFKTGEVREGDSKGRHTTTFRELCRVEGGGMLIDTPGMREIQIWADDAALSGSFEDIESIAARCRFNDCSHESEPGCAVQEAIREGQLAATRLASYRKLQRELTFFAAKQDAQLRAERKGERKKFARTIRKRPTKRD